MVLPSSHGIRVQTAPVTKGSGPENNREVHSSPPVVSLREINKTTTTTTNKTNKRIVFPCMVKKGIPYGHSAGQPVQG